jgi:hypothetical protein
VRLNNAIGAGCGLAVVALWAVWISQATPDPYSKQATCLPDHCFCESVRQDIPRQPADAWSSLAFVVVGVILVSTAARLSAFDAAYAASLYVIGIASGYYHALLTFNGQVADVLGMYLLVTLVLCFRLLGKRPARYWIMAWLGLNLPGLAIQIIFPATRRYLFAALILTVLITEVRVKRSHKYLWVSLGLLGAGFSFWVLDITRLLCQPTSLIQGHALWHVLGAASAFFLYRHIVSTGTPESNPHGA